MNYATGTLSDLTAKLKEAITELSAPITPADGTLASATSQLNELFTWTGSGISPADGTLSGDTTTYNAFVKLLRNNRAARFRAENGGKTVLRRGRRFIEFDDGGGRIRHVATIERMHKADLATEINTAWQPDTGAWQWKIGDNDWQAHARSVFNAGDIYELAAFER